MRKEKIIIKRKKKNVWARIQLGKKKDGVFKGEGRRWI